jgi:hypothetical protein
LLSEIRTLVDRKPATHWISGQLVVLFTKGRLLEKRVVPAPLDRLVHDGAVAFLERSSGPEVLEHGLVVWLEEE